MILYFCFVLSHSFSYLSHISYICLTSPIVPMFISLYILIAYSLAAHFNLGLIELQDVQSPCSSRPVYEHAQKDSLLSPLSRVREMRPRHHPSRAKLTVIAPPWVLLTPRAPPPPPPDTHTHTKQNKKERNKQKNKRKQHYPRMKHMIG